MQWIDFLLSEIVEKEYPCPLLPSYDYSKSLLPRLTLKEVSVFNDSWVHWPQGGISLFLCHSHFTRINSLELLCVGWCSHDKTNWCRIRLQPNRPDFLQRVSVRLFWSVVFGPAQIQTTVLTMLRKIGSLLLRWLREDMLPQYSRPCVVTSKTRWRNKISSMSSYFMRQSATFIREYQNKVGTVSICVSCGGSAEVLSVSTCFSNTECILPDYYKYQDIKSIEPRL